MAEVGAGVSAADGDVPRSLGRLSGPVIFLAAGLTYAGITQALIWVNSSNSLGPMLWPGAGISLAALLMLPERRWGWVIVAVVVAELTGNLARGYPLIPSLWWTVGNGIEPLIGATLLRRFGNPRGDLLPLRNLMRFLLFGVIVAPMFGAAIGARGTLIASTGGETWWQVWPRYVAGDALGVLVVAPLILTRRVRRQRRPPVETVAISVVAASIAFLALHSPSNDVTTSLPYLIVPVLAWSALRFGLRGAAVVVFVMTQVATWAAVGGSFGSDIAVGSTADIVLPLFFIVSGCSVLVAAVVAEDLVERSEVERQLRERAYLLLDSTGEGIFGVDREGRFVFVNPAAAAALGFEIDDLVGQNSHLLVHHHHADGSVYPWEECPTYRTLQEGTANRTDREVFWRRDGTSFPAEYSSRPFHEHDVVAGAVVVFSDITERVAADQALRAYRLMFEHTRDGVLFTSPAGEIHSANPAACDILRMSEDEICRLGRSGLADPTDDRWTAAAERARRGRFRGELRMLRGDGSTFVADVSSAVFGDEAGNQRASVIFRDVSDRAALIEEKARAAEAADAASRLKSEFLATMSHEIRTPMNGVIGMAGLLLDSDLTAEQRDYAETLRGSAETLLTILNDILDFSKIEAGRLELEEVDFDLAVVAEEVAELLAPAAHDKGLELVVQIDPAVPGMYRGDPGRVRQIVMNLVGNAIKFTDQGAVQLNVAAVMQDDADVARFEVRDTGVGIAPEAQGRLFDSFMQADAGTTRRFGGTGLGLTICKRLIELMGGDIGVDSALGEGSTFWFAVPLRRSTAPVPPRPKTLVGLRALVVDDVPINGTVLTAQLAVWGITAVAVSSGEAALAALAPSQGPGARFDIVLSDLEMPGMDGLALADAISQSISNPPPVILLSSAGGRDSAHGRSSGSVARFLVKPPRRSHLFDAIATALGEAPSRRVTPPPVATARPRAGGRVLVVDDNAVNQRLATLLVQKAGYSVDAAGDGAEAVQATLRRGYDAVLMDCEMPVMDGYTAAAEIRRHEAGRRRVPIIAVTASAMNSDVERALAAGMDAHVAKRLRG